MALDEIAVFAKVVQAGSFTQAARLLGMPNTTVSAKVASLEKRLGVTLIRRTTRKLHVTQAGEQYFRRCVLALEELEAAETEVTSAQMKPQGMLRVTASVDVGHTLLPPIVRMFLKKYPEMEIDLLVTNRVVDLVAEGVDVAFRAGELEDSTMIARRFVSAGLTFWAAPSFLKRRKPASHPKELLPADVLRFSGLAGDRLELTRGKEKASIVSGGRIAVDDLETIKAFVVAGEGYGLFPSFICEDEVRRGKLVSVLPGWVLGAGHFSLVYPAQKFVSPKIQAFIEVALEHAKACPSTQVMLES